MQLNPILQHKWMEHLPSLDIGPRAMDVRPPQYLETSLMNQSTEVTMAQGGEWVLED